MSNNEISQAAFVTPSYCGSKKIFPLVDETSSHTFLDYAGFDILYGYYPTLPDGNDHNHVSDSDLRVR